MREAATFLDGFGLVELDDLDLIQTWITSLLMSGRKDPMPRRNGCCGLLEKPSAKIFHGAVYVITWFYTLSLSVG